MSRFAKRWRTSARTDEVPEEQQESKMTDGSAEVRVKCMPALSGCGHTWWFRAGEEQGVDGFPVCPKCKGMGGLDRRGPSSLRKLKEEGC